ncbi:E3 ubiquitin-protein ligase KEG like protein [Aduncisulcus paluster]|uniref:E3 ubiquitin-protein ligase KEG like protein n=1 Tax=Aduncisulcus paluster TaxID=2918883 RepID=A0ABQ5KVK7_9EUKA|nr:E3 ubiquitin-protein ligase KEG like protein [Aduncisulcus paluster]
MDRQGEYKKGDHVQVLQTLAEAYFGWGSYVRPGCIGVVSDFGSKGELILDFEKEQQWYCLPKEVTHFFPCKESIVNGFKIGDYVTVKAGIEPKNGWGFVKKGSTGQISAISKTHAIYVEFPEQAGWRCFADELEKAPEPLSPNRIFNSGDKVRIRNDITEFAYGLGDVTAQMLGVVQHYDADGDVVVDFPPNCTEFCFLESELVLVSSVNKIEFQIGQCVRVKQSVNTPKYGWGEVSHGMIGEIKAIDADGDLKIDFHCALGWYGHPDEMEIVKEKATVEKTDAVREIEEMASHKARRDFDEESACTLLTESVDLMHQSEPGPPVELEDPNQIISPSVNIFPDENPDSRVLACAVFPEISPDNPGMERETTMDYVRQAEMRLCDALEVSPVEKDEEEQGTNCCCTIL